MRILPRPVSGLSVLVIACLSTTACSDSSGNDEPDKPIPTAGRSSGAGGKAGSSEEAGGKGGSKAQAGTGGTSKPDAPDDAGVTQPDEPDEKPTPTKGLYAIAAEVYNPDNTSSTYLSVVTSLDIDHIDAKAARELPGRADVFAYEGKLFVTSSESPTIKRYTVADDGKLSEEKTISFASLGVQSTARPNVALISPTKAYVGIDTGFAIWDPSSMTITGTFKVPEIQLLQDGLQITGNSGLVRGDKFYMTYAYVDWQTYEFSKESYLAVIDTKADKLLSIAKEERCPALVAPMSIDEAGTIYASNWFFNVPGTLIHGAPHSCAVRVPKDSDKPDPNWTLEFDQIAAGHEGSLLSATAKGRGIFSVFHQEDYQIPKEPDLNAITASANWETWTVDLAEPASAKPIAGLARAAATQANCTVDGRTFVFAINTDYTKTRVFEVLADAKSREAFAFDGASFNGFVKIK